MPSFKLNHEQIAFACIYRQYNCLILKLNIDWYPVNLPQQQMDCSNLVIQQVFYEVYDMSMALAELLPWCV